MRAVVIPYITANLTMVVTAAFFGNNIDDSCHGLPVFGIKGTAYYLELLNGIFFN